MWGVATPFRVSIEPMYDPTRARIKAGAIGPGNA